MDAHGLPVRIIVTSGAEADCKRVGGLLEGVVAPACSPQRHDANAVLELAKGHGMEAEIPSKKNRKGQRGIDAYLYKLRHLVENVFLRLKEWRAMATRYAKRQKSYLPIVCLRCALLWAEIS